MKIKVKGYIGLKKAMGDNGLLEMDMENATIRGVLDDLSDRLGKDFRNLIFDPRTKELSNHIRVLVNGRHYNYLPRGLDTELKGGDEVALFPPIAGG